jgi:hypothetical protein
VGGVYKIIAKVLANRLSLVLEKIIYKSQNVFVKRRQILVSILIANKCFNRKHELKEFFVNWTLEKAYNQVDWAFLPYVLQSCGFSEKWRR